MLIYEFFQSRLGGGKVQLWHISNGIYQVLFCLRIEIQPFDGRSYLFLSIQVKNRPSLLASTGLERSMFWLSKRRSFTSRLESRSTTSCPITAATIPVSSSIPRPFPAVPGADRSMVNSSLILSTLASFSSSFVFQYRLIYGPVKIKPALGRQPGRFQHQDRAVLNKLSGSPMVRMSFFFISSLPPNGSTISFWFSAMASMVNPLLPAGF